jgi:FkbM family methyltransferase
MVNGVQFPLKIPTQKRRSRMSTTIEPHEIFAKVAPFDGPCGADNVSDFFGFEHPAIWYNGPPRPALPPHVRPLPPFNEEYFEIVDILESVEAARGRYVMMELGAGFGRWGFRAALAAKRRGIEDIHIVLVEGLPKHVRWIGEAREINGLQDVKTTVIPKAIAYTGQPVEFLTESEHNPEWWFGQCIAFEGATKSGYSSTMVDTVTMEEVCAGLDRIDLVDMDLQRAERELIANSMDVLNAKVQRVHIGTHTPEIEEELRVAFGKAHWKKLWDFETGKVNDTPFGPVKFVDGVQSWINPRID